MTVKNIKYTTPTTGGSTSTATIVKGTTAVGGQETLLIADMTVHQLMEQILIELRILNLRQQEAFEETVNEEDIS